jgi:hypothetical protein
MKKTILNPVLLGILVLVTIMAVVYLTSFNYTSYPR